MGASTVHHSSAPATDHDFHAAVRRRHEHHFHPLELLHSRRARSFLLVLLLLAVALTSYRLAANQGHERLARTNAHYRALLAEKRGEESTLQRALQRNQHSIQANEEGTQAYQGQIVANREELARATRSLESLRRELARVESSIAQLDATLLDKKEQTTVRAAELDKLRTEQSALMEERDQLSIEIQRLSSRLEDARATLAEEQRLETFRRSKP